MQSTASLTLTGTASVGRFGAAAAGAGDVDADGYADLVIGVPDSKWLVPTGSPDDGAAPFAPCG